MFTEQVLMEYRALPPGGSIQVELEGGPQQFWAVQAVATLLKVAPALGCIPTVRRNGAIYTITKRRYSQ